ncbi:MAG: glycerol-3-phosphate dehydrogenase/oxidase [Anaerolineaceae bacterium]|nr:MAG: glycerol-3-phosphate dehydrogenase/oxidase [Anaerolineaceae bacterium]
MWYRKWRDQIWSQVVQEWDIIVIGGGITGAGILREATKLGLHVLLVEQRDFAWGTSSRSSKLVHGGLRYLKEGNIMLTRASVQEREQLLRDGPGLIEPLDFLLATYDGDSPGRLTYGAGLTIYDLLALRWSHRYYSTQDFRLMAGNLSYEGLEGGYRYGDAQTDDARLVLRIIREAVAGGGTALNYVKAEQLVRNKSGQVTGVQLRNLESNKVANVLAPVIINATGAWADRLRHQLDATARIRPLRGSHLIFPDWRLPVAQAVSFLHPIDGRPVFLFPWEGVTLVGTTDVDYNASLEEEPGITAEEVAYLMAAVEARYPMLGISLDDIIASFAGVRPVIGSGKENPSEESRDHVIWQEDGLITVTGGKLTTFRLVAFDVLDKVRHFLPDLPDIDKELPILDQIDKGLPDHTALDETTQRRLLGRYGVDAYALVETAQDGELEPISGTPILWAELRWAARAEGVVHLDDLLLRRVRLGLMIHQGGKSLLSHIRSICQPELAWDDSRWRKEESAYLSLWQRCYALPPRSTIPDWLMQLERAKEKQETAVTHRRSRKRSRRLALTALLTTFIISFAIFFARRRLGSIHCEEEPLLAKDLAATVFG